MGRIDNSELLGDLDFVEPVVLIQRTVTVSPYGESQIVEKPLQTLACVTPAGPKAIMRLPEEMRIQDVRSFVIRGRIVADANGRYSDVLVWQGDRYQIQSVLDYSNWGTGFSEGICVRERAAK